MPRTSMWKSSGGQMLGAFVLDRQPNGRQANRATPGHAEAPRTPRRERTPTPETIAPARASGGLAIVALVTPIGRKIEAELLRRGAAKRRLAQVLGISPQTMTDICKGRSTVTIAHLQGLVRFFGLSADYWLDDDRAEPTPIDAATRAFAPHLRALAASGILAAEDPAALLDRLCRFAADHADDYAARFAPLDPVERRLLRRQEPHAPADRVGPG
jgi:transcriptional regulator with XRE-family HTH domain